MDSSLSSGGGREIVTIQCGPFANMVGAHFWNIQAEAYDYFESQPKSEDESEQESYPLSTLFRGYVSNCTLLQ
jgi:hypothetical protein